MESLDEDHSQPDIQDELPITLPPGSTAPPPSKTKGEDEKKDQRKDVPVLSKEKVEDWEKVSDVYNGAAMENYKWSQTITDIDVRIPVPEGTTAKHVKVDIRSDYLKVELLRPTHQVKNASKYEDVVVSTLYHTYRPFTILLNPRF